MSSFLLQFPTELVCLVLSQWLEPRDVGRLDSAYCKKEERLVLLETAFKSPLCILRHPSIYSICNLFANWVHIRGMHLCELLITNQTNLTNYIADMERNGKYVKSIKLYKVDMSVEHIEKDVARIIKHCNNLAALVCYECTLNESIIEILRHGTQLQDFTLTYCKSQVISQGSKHDGMAEQKESMNKYLRNVTVDFKKKSPLFCNVVRILPTANIQRLSVFCKSEMEIQTTLQKVSECASTLRCLSFNYTHRLGEAHVASLVSMCPHILHLSVSDCIAFTDECCLTVARYLMHLRTLNIMYCNVTDISLLSLAKHRHATLEGLFTCNTGIFTGTGFNAVFEKCHILNTVALTPTDAILGTLNQTLLRSILTLQLQLYQADYLHNILPAFSSLTHLYISCSSNVIREIFLPDHQQLPTLTKFCFCTTHFCDVPEPYDLCCTTVPASLLDKFRSQRPNLLVTIEPGENWPSYLMKQPL